MWQEARSIHGHDAFVSGTVRLIEPKRSQVEMMNDKIIILTHPCLRSKRHGVWDASVWESPTARCLLLTHVSVPLVFAVLPGEFAEDRRDRVPQIEEGPRQDHVVVDANERRHQEHCVADACTKQGSLETVAKSMFRSFCGISNSSSYLETAVKPSRL